jgi:hypothetical protein
MGAAYLFWNYGESSSPVSRLVYASFFGLVAEVFLFLFVLGGIAVAGSLLGRKVSLDFGKDPLTVVVLGGLLACSAVYVWQHQHGRSQMAAVIDCVKSQLPYESTGERFSAADQVQWCVDDLQSDDSGGYDEY